MIKVVIKTMIPSLFSLMVFYSCNESKSHVDFAAPDTPKSENINGKLDSMVVNVLKDYPNYKSNSIAREKATIDLIATLQPKLSPTILDDGYYHVRSIFKNPNDKGYIVHLYGTRQADYKSSADNTDVFALYNGIEICYDILGRLSEDEASKINEDKTVRIKCTSVKRLLTEKEIAKYIRQTYYYQLMRIGNEKRAVIELGVFICDISEILV